MTMVVMGDKCVQSITAIRTIIRLLCDQLLKALCCCHGDGSDWRHVYHGNAHYYQATMLVIVINCLRLFVVVIYCCHGDGSDGRHVCSKNHGHTHYHQATMLVIVINCLGLSGVVNNCHSLLPWRWQRWETRPYARYCWY